MSNKAGKAALVVAIIAMIASFAGMASAARFLITSSAQIKPGVILTNDIHKNAVRATDIQTGAVKSADLATGAVQSADIGEGQVQPEDVTAPEPEQIPDQGATVEVTDTFALVDPVGAYTKEDPTSVLLIEWVGTARAEFSGCVFQIRVNGQPATAQGGGEVFVSNGSTWSGSTSALFDGFGAGPVNVEVWAKATISGTPFPCTVGPAGTIPQSFVVSEAVV